MSSNLQDEKDQIELETAEVEQYLQTGEDLIWLLDTPQFQRVIVEGYLREKPLASVSMLADPGVIRRGERSAIMEDLVASSNLSYYFNMVMNQYHGAMNTEVDHEDEDESEAGI